MAQLPTFAVPAFSVDQGLEYYAGKSKLLDWVNRLLDLNLQRLEQLTSGAVYCQILDAFYADVVAIRKVNFLAREEYEILPNYKILQAAFNTLGFTKELDVAKLSRASTSDLMEFTQWLYKSFNGVITVPNYNPAARRQMSLKGATNTIPFPACVVNSSFEFGRSDLRTSGSWSTATPPEPTKLAPRALRSNSNTPGTSGKSATKRNTPYVNVSSRYREGLAVPPDHYDRRSPRLSPGSGGTPLHRVPVNDGGTQTDFVDEEYRPMTATDVGTEVASPRLPRRDFGGQGDDRFGYADSLSRSESLASVCAAPVSPAGQMSEEAFSFGQQPNAAAGLGAPGLASASSLTPVPSTPEPTLAPDDASRVPDVHAPVQQQSEHSEAYLCNGVAGLSLAGSNDVDAADASAPAADAAAPDEEEAALATAFGTAAAATAAGFRDEGRNDHTASVDTPRESAAATHSTAESRGAETGHDDGQLDLQGSVSLSHPAATPTGPHTARDSTAPFSARETVVSPAPASSASASAATSPSPRTAPWRSSGTMLPPEVASLLASPAARTRVASASCLRDMAAAIDAGTAALQAVDKSVESFSALLASTPSTGSAACSPALCGKARSLQDALQTLLGHTMLLLGDVQAYSEATHPQPFSASPSRGGAVTSDAGAASPRPPDAGVGAESGPERGKPARNFAAEASALLETARSLESRLEALAQKARDVLQLPNPGSETRNSGSAFASSSSGTHRHLTDEQRKLCSTSLLDGHLKAVGMAQFALVQDIHRELAALTSTYFRHTGITNGGESSTGGGEGSTGGGVGSTGGVSTSSSRKARVFKLGEYQLKQLRNGDIYKGRYVCNKKNGEGVYHFINADVYEGEFRDDRMDGYGVYTFSHEGRYEGQWRNAVYNGTGAETFAKGSTYHGEYAGGLRNGWGVCRFYNGDYYEGQWAKGLRDGSGMQQCTDDSNFVGDYHRGKRHGHGVYSFPNGDRYEGQYSEDLPHGHGTYHFASGQCYQGQWQQGKKHGWSVYTVDNGSRFMGLWSEGKPTWVQPLTGDTAAAGVSEESGRALRQAMDARDLAVQAAAEARVRAVNHWEVGGLIQTKLLTALSNAQSSASSAQQARRKACDLAGRLDSAVALLQTQGAAAPLSSMTP